MLLTLCTHQVVFAASVENPYVNIPFVYKNPNALAITLASDRAEYVFGDPVYLRIMLRNTSSEVVVFSYLRASVEFELQIVPQGGSPLLLPKADFPMVLGGPVSFPTIAPGKMFIEFGKHEETLIPISDWGYSNLPRGKYSLTVYPHYGRHAVASNTIQVIVQ